MTKPNSTEAETKSDLRQQAMMFAADDREKYPEAKSWQFGARAEKQGKGEYFESWAFRYWAKTKRKPGRPVGTLRPGATASINIRLTPERKKQLLYKATRDNTTMSGVVDNWIGLCFDD